MRIAMIGCKGIPASLAYGGGIESHVEELSVRLAAKGHHVAVYVRSYANPKRQKHFRGVRLITLPTVRRKHFDAIVHTVLATFHALFTPYDIIHFHGVGPSTIAWIPRLLKPWSRVVVTFHSRDRFHEKWGRVARAYLAFGEWTSVAYPHATIAVSHTIQLFCRKMFGAKAFYIPNGVEVPSLHPGSDVLEQFGLKPNGYLYTLSRFIPHKAVDDAIRAFAGVETDKKLVIIGWAKESEHAYLDQLEELASHDNRVMFVGRQTGLALQQIMAHGYAMVHASRSEGLSLSILEAMSYGKLVLMSDIPENLELIDHSGISFPVGNIEKLRDAIQLAVSDPELAVTRGHRAREVIRHLYSWDTVVSRVEDLYMKLKG